MKYLFKPKANGTHIDKNKVRGNLIPLAPNTVVAGPIEPINSAQVLEAGIVEYIAPGASPKPVTKLSPLQFYDRFTDQEKGAILLSDDGLVQAFVNRLNLIKEVSFDSPTLLQAMDYLVHKGLITEYRKFKILK